MANYKKIFMKHLDHMDVGYEERDDYTLKTYYNGENLKTIPIIVYFDEDGDPMVQFKCWDIANFKGKEGKGLVACNKINNEYRWIKFSIDEDADIVASCDAYIDIDTCADICSQLALRMGGIIDDAYPEFAKAMWS